MYQMSKITIVGLLLASSAVSGKNLAAKASNFNKVLAAAKGGDKIVLSGDIGLFRIRGASYSSLVTIDASAAHFTDSFVIYNAQNIEFTGGVYGNTTDATSWGRAVQVYNSSNIGFNQAQFVGNGLGGAGVKFDNVNGAYVVNSTFNSLAVAAGLTSVSGGTLINNVIVGQTKDGFDLAASQNITASHNSCLGANPSPGAHPDCIQIWSLAGRAPSANITIADNLSYGASQGFTKFSSGGGASKISIVRNVVESTYPQGIACYDCTDSSVRDNFLVTLKSSPHLVNLHLVGGSGNQVQNNAFVRASSNVFVTPANPGVVYSAGLLDDGAHAAIPALATTTIAPAKLSTQVQMVPEPAIWASLAAGFGLQGGAMRLRRAQRMNGVAAS